MPQNFYRRMNYSSEEERRLKAELSIVKSQLNSLKKENKELRREKCISFQEKLDEEHELKKKIRMLEKENQFMSTEFQTQLQSNQDTHLFTPDPLLGLFKDNGKDLKYALHRMVSSSNFLSDEMLSRLKVFKDYFFEDFFAIEPEKIIEAIENSQTYGQKFVDIFLLFSLHRPIFEKYWELFFNLPLYIKEKRMILENVPVEWVIDHIGDPPTPKKFMLVYEKPETINGLKKYIIRYNSMLHEFFCRLVEKRSDLLNSLFPQEAFDSALLDESPLATKLILMICNAGGLGYITEMNIEYLNEIQLSLCFKNDFPLFIEGEILESNFDKSTAKAEHIDLNRSDKRSEDNESMSIGDISFDGDLDSSST